MYNKLYNKGVRRNGMGVRRYWQAQPLPHDPDGKNTAFAEWSPAPATAYEEVDEWMRCAPGHSDSVAPVDQPKRCPRCSSAYDDEDMSVMQGDVKAALAEIEHLRLVIQSAHSALAAGHVADAQHILREAVEGGRRHRGQDFCTT
jgi:hypothetical protein